MSKWTATSFLPPHDELGPYPAQSWALAPFAPRLLPKGESISFIFGPDKAQAF